MPQKPERSAGACSRTEGATATGTGSLAILPTTRRNWLDWLGLIFGATAPPRGVIVEMVFQSPVGSSCCSSTEVQPLAVPLNAVPVPYVSGVAGAPRASTPTWNQVDRSPRAARTRLPVAVTWPFDPVATTLCTRPEEDAIVWTSRNLPGDFMPRASLRAVYWYGPQL